MSEEIKIPNPRGNTDIKILWGLIDTLEEQLKLKTQNEVNASVNADCLEGCRAKCNELMSQHKADIEKLQNQNLDLINKNGKLSDQLKEALTDWVKALKKVKKAEKVIGEIENLIDKYGVRKSNVFMLDIMEVIYKHKGDLKENK